MKVLAKACPLLHPSSMRFFSSHRGNRPGLQLSTSSQQAYQRYQALSKEHTILLTQTDGAGTIFDPYCLAPYLAFTSIFSRFGIHLSHEQITGPMGMNKVEHIRHLLEELRPQWIGLYDRPPSEEDVQELYKEFKQSLHQNIADQSTPLPFALDAMRFLDKAGIKAAFTSGYASEAAGRAQGQFDRMLRLNRVAGFKASTVADEVPEGTRYAMVLSNMKKLGIMHDQIHRTVFVTDAKSDIANLRQAKELPWIFAVANYSTHVGITKLCGARFPNEMQLQYQRAKAFEMLQNSQPHAVLNNLSELPWAIVAASQALERGQRPHHGFQLDIKGLRSQDDVPVLANFV